MKKIKIIRNKKKTDYFRVFASSYYIWQYLFIHFLLFGFTFEIAKIAPKIITVFHWKDILIALYNFKDIFIAGITFQSVILCFMLFIPYILILIWHAKYVIIFVFVIFQLLWYSRIKFKSWLHELGINLNNVVIIKIGAPGCGKSSSGLYEAVIMARKMWRELRWKHYCYSFKVNKWRKTNNIQKLIEWEEIKFSYNFFKKNKCVPCLLTNIPVMVDGVYTCLVGKKHLEQELRLPAYAILFFDEIGVMTPVDAAKQRTGKDKKEAQNAIAVSDFFRLCRHYGNWRIIGTEQDSKNIYIDARRVVQKNEYMLSQKWVLKPYLFLAVFLPLKAFCIRFEKWNEVFAPPLMFLEKLIKYIGFRKYRYCTENNTERERGMEAGKKTFYLPSMLNFHYDERTFRNLYKCKDKECKPYIFENLVLEDNDMFKDMFLRSERIAA